MMELFTGADAEGRGALCRGLDAPPGHNVLDSQIPGFKPVHTLNLAQ